MASGGMLYAMRGNVAAGETVEIRAVLAEYVQAVISPEALKADLVKATPGVTSEQVHDEACALANRLERELLGMTAADGRPLSVLVDRGLFYADDVRSYGEMARRSGRGFALFDVDAPLEHSLISVMEREPGGADPRPAFDVIEAGFKAVRANRQQVIDLFMEPTMGTYRLYATNPRGDRVPILQVARGELAVTNAELYAQAITPFTGSLATTRISAEWISEYVDSLQSPESNRASTLTGDAAKSFMSREWERVRQLKSELVRTGRADAERRGKEPFDLRAMELLCDTSHDGRMPPVHERIAELEWRYYVDYPDIMTIRDFAKKVEDLSRW